MDDLLSKLSPYWVEVSVLSGLLVFGILLFWLKAWRIKSIRGGPVKDLSFHQPAEHNLMGKVRLDEGVIEVPVSELRFSVSGTGSGLVADVTAELKIIFQQLAAGDKGKVDFFREMIGLEEKYEELFSHPGLVEVRQFIKSHAPFALSREELTGFWG
ncbi:hypothetical protein [Pedobacter jeongneungensis]|uniref:hypothetical protein n=1 Tax=Pedobacter jeongneungensis TaxID=947309 RepID=UPI0013B470BE|nr:hypothetical protein [Pedobacter jeongneungensis]